MQIQVKQDYVKLKQTTIPSPLWHGGYYIIPLLNVTRNISQAKKIALSP